MPAKDYTLTLWRQFGTILCAQVDSLADGADKEALRLTVARIAATYDELSQQYHTEKGTNHDNSLAFD